MSDAAELERLRRLLAEREQALALREEQVALLKASNERLARENAQLKQQALGTKPERWQPSPEQLALWGLPENPEPPKPPKEPRKRRKGGRRPLPKELPRETVSCALEPDQRLCPVCEYVFGFVRPDTGRVFSLLMPTVSTAVMSICLEHFANEVGTNATRRIVLVLDGAGWHTAKDLVVPEGIDLVFQPPYSPELQPSEQLWPLLHEPLANRNFVDLDELEDVLCEACCGLEDDPEYLRSQTLFHWWSDAIR